MANEVLSLITDPPADLTELEAPDYKHWNKLYVRAERKDIQLSAGAFTVNGVAYSSLYVVPAGVYGTITDIAIAWNTANGSASSDSNGTMLIDVFKVTGGSSKALLNASQSAEGSVLTDANPALTGTTADLDFAPGDTLFFKLTNNSPEIDNNTVQVGVTIKFTDRTDAL